MTKDPNGTFFKVYRSVFDNPVVMKDADYLAVWIWLLGHVTHRNYDTLFAGKRITLQPGQWIVGRKMIGAELHINEHKVDRILKAFISEHQIERQSTPHGSVITIVNWHKYNPVEQQDERQVSAKCATSEQQVRTKQEQENRRTEELKDGYSVKYDSIGGATI